MAQFSETTTYEVHCPACECDRVIRVGVRNGQQRYQCKECSKKFRANGKATGRRMDAELMGSAIRDFYTGKSYKQICEGLRDEYDIPEPSKATIYEWVRDFTDQASAEMANHKAETGKEWVADELVVDVGGQNAWLWNVMDGKTRYILASHLSRERDGKAATTVLRKALAAADKPPESFFSDKLRSYLPALRAVIPDAKHFQSEGLDADINNNLSERLQGTFRDRIKTLRGLDNLESGQRYLDGWTITYNLFRGHHSLRNQTPGYRAKVKPPFKEWADVVKGDAVSPKPIEAETRLAAPPKQRKVKMPRIQPPKCGQQQSQESLASPIPPSAFAAMPRALRPKPPKAGRKARAHFVG